VASSVRYEVKVSRELASQLAELKAAADESKAKRQLYNSLKRCAVELLREHAGSERDLLTAPLRRAVYRIKQGRLRTFDILSERKKLVVMLMVGMRKQRDKHDAYEVLNRRIRAGDFDPQFEECGIQRPAL